MQLIVSLLLAISEYFMNKQIIFAWRHNFKMYNTSGTGQLFHVERLLVQRRNQIVGKAY